jgi:hypothetical protein
MDIYLTRLFARLLKKSGILPANVNRAIRELLDDRATPLGHKLYKQRIGSRGRGKSGAYRSIAYYRRGELVIFVYLFAKNDQANLTDKQADELRLLARDLDRLGDEEINAMVRKKLLTRWPHYDEEKEEEGRP